MGFTVYLWKHSRLLLKIGLEMTILIWLLVNWCNGELSFCSERLLIGGAFPLTSRKFLISIVNLMIIEQKKCFGKTNIKVILTKNKVNKNEVYIDLKFSFKLSRCFR